MKRDGRLLDHRTLEAIRLMAVERVRDGERPSSVVASYGFNRTTIYRWLSAAASGTESAAREAGDGSATQFDATPGATGVSLGQWSRSAPVWPGLWIVGTVGGGRADRAQIRHSAWCDGGGRTARQVGTDTAKAAAARLPA